MNFEPYAVGLCHASVCTSLSVEEATRLLNRNNPTGIESQWKLSDDKNFKSGEANGFDCPDHPGNKHYLFVC